MTRLNLSLAIDRASSFRICARLGAASSWFSRVRVLGRLIRPPRLSVQIRLYLCMSEALHMEEKPHPSQEVRWMRQNTSNRSSAVPSRQMNRPTNRLSLTRTRQSVAPCTIRIPALPSCACMAEAGSFADRVKQQADIVRIVGEYVRLKKSGQNFTGLCPFHSEKSPSFAVHPVKQIYHCFGCGAGGDVFKFIMEMDKSTFPDAVRAVAEKCGIAIPQAKRTHARGAPAESATHFARGNASRSRGIFCAAIERLT